MANKPFTVEVEGLEETLAAFSGVERGMLDLRTLGVWKAVQSVFYKLVKEVFASEGSSNKGGQWKALSPAYQKVKLRKWGNQPILTASGEMYRSLTSAGAKNAVYEESAQEMVIGTSDPKAGYHQKGNSRLPKREILAFTDEQEGQLIKPIQEKLKQLVGNAKLKNLRGF